MMRFIVALALIAPCSYAAEVLKVKGQKALISTQGDALSAGQTYAAMQGGKKKAIIKIFKVKGEKAIGKVMEGTAASGMTLKLQSGGGGSDMMSGSQSGSKRRSSRQSEPGGRQYWGAMLGFSMDTMSVTVYKSTDNSALGVASLSGSGFSALGLFDYEIFPQFWFRGMGGIEQFSVTGDQKCGDLNNQACTANIMYLAGDLIGRYVFFNGNFRPWIGLGVELLFPASKSSTALKPNSIGTTNAITPQLGFDYFISPTMYIPVSVEYGLLPDSNEVKAHWIAARAGFAVPF